MKINFQNIEQIYNLLTLDEWIIDQTLQDEYLTEDLYPKLLINLHLLYDTRFNEQSCTKLKALIENRFSSINSPQIYAELENIKLSTTHNSLNCHVYDKTEKVDEKLFLYCLIISQIYSKNDELIFNMISKLERYFGSTETAIWYLAEIDYSSRSTIESRFKYKPPNITSKQSLDFWQALNTYTLINKSKKELNNTLTYFSYGHLLEKHTDFKGLLKKYSGPNSLNEDTISTIKRIFSEQSYQYKEEDLLESIKPLVKDLVLRASEVLLNGDAFKRTLSFLKEGKLKTKDNMPDISFEFKMDGKIFTFKKLPIKDMRSFILGKYTYCCQSIGDKAEFCIIDGMSKKNAGFYVVTNVKDQIRMQSYAWLGTEDSLVFDSFECADTNEGKKLFIECIKELLKEKVPQKIYIGAGGGTPKVNALKITRDVEPLEADLCAYSDSSNVYCILSEQNLQCINTTLNGVENLNIHCKNFEEFENYHRLVQFNLLKGSFKYYYQQLCYLIDNGATTNMLVEMEKHDPFYFVDILIEHANNVVNLIQNNVHIKDLVELFYIKDKLKLKEFLADQDIILFFIRNGMNFEELKNMCFNYQYKYDLFKKHITKIQYLLTNGINLQELIDIYDKTPEKAALFIKNGNQIQYLLTNGINLQELIDIYDKTPEKAELFIKNGNQIQYLRIRTNLMSLMTLYDSKKENIKLIIRNGQQVQYLLTNGINLQELIDMYDSSSKKAELFIKNGQQVQYLLTNGINLQELIDMYDSSSKKAQIFIENAREIDSISQLITARCLMNWYDKKPENTQFFIEKIPALVCLKKYHPLGDLIGMFNTQFDCFKFLAEYAEQISYLVKDDQQSSYDHYNEPKIYRGGYLPFLQDNSITLQYIIDMYVAGVSKTELFIKNGRLIRLLTYRSNITITTLMEIYDNNPEKVKFFLQHGEKLLWLIGNHCLNIHEYLNLLDHFAIKNPHFLLYHGITLECLLNLYDSNLQKAKLFIEYGIELVHLVNKGITIERLSTMHNDTPEKAELFIEYGEHVAYLIDNGAMLQELLDIYDNNPEKVKLFMEYGDIDSMGYLLYAFKLSELMDMYDSNPEKVVFLLDHGQDIETLHLSGIVVQDLIKIYDHNIEHARLLVENSDNIRDLTYYGIVSVETLINMYERGSSQKAEFFIYNATKIKNFLKVNHLCFDELVECYRHDKTIEEVMKTCKFLMKDNEQVRRLSDNIDVLVDMCYDASGHVTLEFLASNYKKVFNLCNNTQVIDSKKLVNICNNSNYKAVEFFVKNDQQMISIINDTKLTFKELLNMYNNSKKFEFFIQKAGKVITKISNTKVAFEKLLEMCDDNSKKFKSFIECTKKIIPKTSNTKITFEELVKEYDSNILKDKKFKNSKQKLDPKNNIYKYDSVDVSIGNKCNEELTPKREQVNYPQNGVEITIQDSHVRSCLKRTSSNNNIENQPNSIPNVLPCKKIKFDIELITECIGELNFNDSTEI